MHGVPCLKGNNDGEIRGRNFVLEPNSPVNPMHFRDGTPCFPLKGNNDRWKRFTYYRSHSPVNLPVVDRYTTNSVLSVLVRVVAENLVGLRFL